MVPHPTIRGLEVSIEEANGRDLIVYNDLDATPTPEPDVVTRYVLASSEQDFRIRYMFGLPTDQDIRVDIYVDGTFVRSLTHMKLMAKAGIWRSVKGPLFRVGEQWFEQQFRFKDLSVTSPHGNGTSDAKELDTIKVVLLQDQPGVSEKELKGEAKPLHIGPSPGPDIKAEGDPFATFIFKYRSRKDLEALGVIPRPSSPSNEDSKVKSEPDIKNEPEIKHKSDEKTDSEIKNEPNVDNPPNVKPEPSPTSERNASRRSPDTSQPNIKREPGLEADYATGTIAALADGQTYVPAKRELEDAEERITPEKKIKHEEEDE